MQQVVRNAWIKIALRGERKRQGIDSGSLERLPCKTIVKISLGGQPTARQNLGRLCAKLGHVGEEGPAPETSPI